MTQTRSEAERQPSQPSEQPSEQPADPPRMLVVGSGEVAVALAQLARVLDWDCRITERVTDHRDVDAVDAVVVLSHDIEIAGTALQTALGAGGRYVGAMGSRTTQRRRHDWLVDHQVSPLRVSEIYGPAGLDIGAERPTEIALSIMAEITAVLHRVPCDSISRRAGSVHATLPGRQYDCPGDLS